jgi:putative ABC transport system permease protein
MNPRRTTNRKMFWRILRRLLTANPGRLFVILLALGSGAAITAALLNLQIDANRRLTSEFRAFGPNVIVTPRASTGHPGGALLDQSIIERIPDDYHGVRITKIGLIYVVVSANPWGHSFKDGPRGVSNAVLVGKRVQDPKKPPSDDLQQHRIIDSIQVNVCKVGPKAAAQLHVHKYDEMELHNGIVTDSCMVYSGEGVGSDEDSQILTNLEQGQHLAGAPNELSQIQLIVWGTPQQISQFLAELQQSLPEAEVTPLRQFTEAQARIYSRISGLLNFTVALVLILTGLCVMAAMTNVAMERRTDVGLMKAIGGSVRRVLRFFLAEAALLGLAGGILGGAVGIALSIGLGKAVFGVAARPRLIVYPVAVALTMLVAIASSYPLRRLATIRPAAVFRGEA